MQSPRSSRIHSEYSSTALRARDRRIFDKYDTRDAERQKQHAFAQERTNFSLFELNNKAHRLATLVGYTNIHDAIKEIETADVGISFRECLLRLQAAEKKLEVEKMDSEVFQLKLEKLEKAHQALKEEVRELQHSCRKLKAEKKDLETRYDNLLDVRLRAEARYKADYKKWRHIYRWLRSDGPDEDHPEVSEEIKKSLSKHFPTIARKRQLIVDGIVDISFMEKHIDDTPTSTPKNKRTQTGNSVKRNNKENLRPSISPSKKRMSASPRKKQCSPRQRASLSPFSNKLLPPVTGTTSSPFPSNQSALSPLHDVQFKLTTDSSHRSPMKSPSTQRRPRSFHHVSDSSETEPDTQSVWIPMKRPLEPRSIFKTPVPPVASSSKIPGTNDSSRTLVDDPTPVPKRAKLDVTESVQPRRTFPIKGRRVSVNEDPSTDVFTARKGNEKENMLLNDGEGDDIVDKYSILKGHGKYAKTKEVDQTDTTINSEFAIDPSNNGGLGYQYDDVIRDRNARKRMHADDCECCKEYYEGVGPLPDRLQPPLWRSPTNSPRKQERVGSSRRQANIELHKKAISRHRHNWARAPTPPGYWDIGFPDTQEVSAINAKASEMHRKKKEEVSKEAARGGRYKKRTR